MARKPAATVTVELTKRDVQVLRRLITEHHARLRVQGDATNAALRSVAHKIWLARKEVELLRLAQDL